MGQHGHHDQGDHHSSNLKALTYQDGEWREGKHPVIGPRDHAMWLSSIVFDGARSLGGIAPDLDLHCARSITSAKALGMEPKIKAEEITRLAWEGIKLFPDDAELYICPMFYAEEGFIYPHPESTRFLLCIYESPIPKEAPFTACLSSFRRPARDMAPTEAKASCLYPNSARAEREAMERGFDHAVVRDPANNVAEFGFMNLFMVKEGVVYTPAINGTFLNGITRQRAIKILLEDGVEVKECALTFEEVLQGDEVFASGNYAKLLPCAKLEQTTFEIGPVYKRLRKHYFDWAKTCTG
ncbi:MAG: branched-chain amino acid aminotransferase [Alphaproteobacteria bacterium]|nr:branched-chain amino acid aminotransferase [Alphaproteobacteria bacterium]